MVFKQSWFTEYYEEPLKECENSKGERIKFYDFDFQKGFFVVIKVVTVAAIVNALAAVFVNV